MSTVPPPNHSAYPREGFSSNDFADAPDAVERLRIAADGFRGIGWVFWAQVAFYFGPGLLAHQIGPVGFFLGFPALLAFLIYVGYTTMKKVAYGLRWSNLSPLFWSIGFVFPPLIGNGLAYTLAAHGISKFGVRKSWTGAIRKEDIEARIAELSAPPRAMPLSA